MSYIGAEPTTGSFPFDQFSGTGAQTAFTLTYAPASTTSIVVAISGVVQNPNTYSIVGTTLTFSPAPPSGTNNIAVLYLGLPSIVGVPNAGTVTPSALSTGGPSWTSGGNVQISTAGTAAAPAIYPTGDTNTGIYFPSADTIAFTEGGVQAGEFDSSANFKFNSGYGSVATAYGCRAWVNFNGTGTVAIRASGNVSSITDNGTGDYTVNFTTAMPDANYSVAGFSNNISPYNYPLGIGYNRNRALTTTSVSIYTGYSGSQASLGGVVDSDYISVQVFR